MKLRELIALAETIAPTRFAESWDNVGLLAGDPEMDVTRVLLTNDVTREVLGEAKRAKANVVYAYHPPLFSPVKHVRAGSLVFDAIRDGIALYSPHTALDVARGGTNDVLADACGIADALPIKPYQAAPEAAKLVTFVPNENLESVADVLFQAGAGKIGDYRSCSFRTEGTGTFFGEAGTTPVVGSAGQLERVKETKLELIVPLSKIDEVVHALRKSHPYEEPAFDLVMLHQAPPLESIGLGRIGNRALPIERSTLIEEIKERLGLTHVLVSGPAAGAVTRIAVLAGSAGDLWKRAIAMGAEVLVTGELRHHDALACSEAGMTVIACLHSNSERKTLHYVQARFNEARFDTLISQVDRDPFVIC
ncbi:MAG: Nif3-like dinuclear metal center hexameric protein [Polyangiaceae bacterium]|nr:Nif3-like dinuclear metal center hexameric protein [Polyangiaceae bacterium]